MSLLPSEIAQKIQHLRVEVLRSGEEQEEHGANLFSSTPLPTRVTVHHVAPSAQQRVWVVTSQDETRPPDDDDDDVGGTSSRLGVVVVRQWRGGSRWWNLHRARHVRALAEAEIAGYRLARKALGNATVAAAAAATTNQNKEDATALSPATLPTVTIPRVLWYSGDGDGKQHPSSYSTRRPSDNDLCWAVMEYVGPPLTTTTHMPPHASPNKKDKNNTSTTSLVYDDAWTTGMIRTRHEFGFDEPHPRWGRVPTAHCLTYVQLVLDQVILPLHRYFFRRKDGIKEGDETAVTATLTTAQQRLALCDGLAGSSDDGYTYQHMVRTYQAAVEDLQASMVSSQHAFHTHDSEYNDDEHSGDSGKADWAQAVSTLALCVAHLADHEAPHVTALPSVLVHMDCQPQNLIWKSRRHKQNHHPLPSASEDMESTPATCGRLEDPAEWYVAAVLDWEDAAYADPRFELLLLARKVCANRQQADHVWSYYQTRFPDVTLGPIDPWLRLETVHSLCTLLLQSMDLLDGGRSPWEGRPDLWAKIQREFARLVAAGWSFCQGVAAEPT